MGMVLSKIAEYTVDPILRKIAEYTVEPIGRQMSYMFFYNKKVRELKSDVVNLGHVKQRVQESVNKDERSGNIIYDDVKKWLEKVDDITANVNNLADDPSQEEHSRSTWSFLNLKSLHQSSKKAIEMAQDVSKLEGEGSSFEGRNVSFRVAPQGLGTEPVKGYEVFESRNKALSGVIEALKRDNVSKIGVYGMGGVGKTMLVKEVARQAMEDKLFDKVGLVVVSQTPNVKEIQDKIAFVLGWKFDVESTISVRADKLHERLKREKSILVIIDDIWDELDLEAVGISFGDDQKGCKLLFTSRSENVLHNDMGSQKKFGLGILSYDEAKYLFGKIVDRLPEDTDFCSVADKIVKECAGLPIAITTIANALKNRSLSVWKDALTQLQRSNPINIKGVPEKVYSSIELSYNYLRSEEAKSLFLLCSLHKEDYDIEINSLLRYGMGLDLFQEVYCWEEARNRVHTLVENLKSSSLLLDGDEDDTVKMHDVIRDVAIHIAAKDKRMFNVGNEVKLLEWSKQKKLKDSTAISLSYTNVCELPERLECPRLMLFLLFNINDSLQIPHPFYEGTKELQVLHLIRMDSQYLSSSLSFLKNLQTLCLNDCEFENIAFIGELENLKVLSLSKSYFKELPKEISQLTNLQVLDLSNCSELEIIPANVLSNLKRLEELDMANSFTSWEVEGESTEGSIARVIELDHLSHLTTLNICILGVKFLPNALIFKKLVRYNICISDDWDDNIEFRTSRSLIIVKWSLQSENLDAVKILLKSCEDLSLIELKGFQNVFYESSSNGFLRMKHLQVEHNDEFQFIIKGHRCIAFPSLESFSLFNMINLEKICHGQLVVGSFHNLREVRVQRCDNLKFVFSSSMVGCFPQLQEMVIITCRVMSTIIATEREEEPEIIDGTKDMMEFTKLHSLILWDLPNLMCLHSDVDSPLLFYKKVSFKNLTRLVVRSCGSLKYLLSSFTARSLVQLKQLKIHNCEVMEETLTTEESGEEKRTDNIWFPKLESLDLQDLPKLMRFCFENLIEFPSLKTLKIADCPEMKTFVSNSLSANLTVNKELEEMNNCALQPFFNEKVSFKNLTTLEVQSCGCFKFLFSSSTARSLVQLKDLEISKCEFIEEILATESSEEKRMDNIFFPKLESLDLEDLPKLMRFSFENLIESPSLKVLKISTNLPVNKELEEMNNFSTQSLFNEKVAVPNLETLEIRGIDNLRMIWHDKLASNSFCQLKEIWVTDCENLMNIFLSNIESILQSQETVKVTEIKGKNVIETGDIVAAQLKLKNVQNMNPQGILLTFQNLHTVTVENCGSLKSLFPISVAKHLTQLERLKIINCGVEDIVAKAEGLETEPKFVFPSLKSLELQNLPELKSFYLGKHTLEWPLLKNLKIENCGKVKIFASDSLGFQETQGQGHHGVSFEQPLFLIEKASFVVEALTLRQNFSMNEIWHGHIPIDLGEEKHGGTLARVKKLNLDELPELVHLSKEDLLADPFFQNMEILDVSKCNKLKNLMSSSTSFQNLTSLYVRNCHGLLNLITSSTAKSLVQLTKMDIVNCKNITEIVTNKGGEAGDNEFLFSQLKFLALRGLPSLTSFYLGNCNIKFPSLKSVIVNGCPELKIFSPGIVTTPKLQRLELSKKYLKSSWQSAADVVVTPTQELMEVDLNATVKTFWEDNFSKSEDQSFKVNTSSNENDSEEAWIFYDPESVCGNAYNL